MSKHAPTNNAAGAPSRRAILAAGSAAAVLSTASIAAVAETPLGAMIERHKAVYAAFNDSCGFEDRLAKDDPRFAARKAECERLSAEEERALNELCAYRPRDIAEVRERADYFRDYVLNWCELPPEQEQALRDSYTS